MQGMTKTEKGHYDGGDSAWEEENKMVYRNSEVRLIEIQENMCRDSSVMDSDQVLDHEVVTFCSEDCIHLRVLAVLKRYAVVFMQPCCFSAVL